MKWLKENGGALKDYTPDQLIEYQKAADNSHRYHILDLVQAYVGSRDGRIWTKRNRYGQLRSFFAHNRAELPRDPTFRIRSDTPAVRGDLSPDDLKKIILSCSPCYAAAFLCMFQGGMGLAELLYWNVHGLERLKEDLGRGTRIIKVDLPGRKSTKNTENFYTFIGGDAIDAIKRWFERRPVDAPAIFVNQYGKPLTSAGLHSLWMNHLVKLGYAKKSHDNSNRTGRGLHELRDCFRTLWAKSPARPEVGEWLMGHSRVWDSNGYDKSYRDVDAYRREYEKALPWLNIMSSGRPFHQVSEEEVESIRAEVERLRAGRDTQIEELRLGLEELRKMIINLMK
jgi:integrase